MLAFALAANFFAQSPASNDELPKSAPKSSDQNTLTRHTYTQIHMGGEFKLTFYAKPELADRAAAAAYSRIAELEQVMSDYRPTSEVRQLKPNVSTPVSEPLWEVLATAQTISKETNGAFDVTAGPAVKLWRNARKTNRMPGPIELAEATNHVDFRQLHLNAGRQEVTITKSGVAIDLGGIAKGYACDQALRVLRSYGVGAALIQAGGDIVIGNPPPSQSGWPVQIPGESELLFLDNCAVSTSGDVEQFVELNGKIYSHIVDPRTGIGVTNRVMATVIADQGVIADPLATALCVLGRDGISVARNFNVRVILEQM